MTADREKLREGLARILNDELFRLKIDVAPCDQRAMVEALLAPILAQADSAERMEAERDEARARGDRINAKLGELNAAVRECLPPVDVLIAEREAAEARADRLSAEVEALRKVITGAAEAAQADSGYSSYPTTIDSEEAHNLRRCRDIVLAARAADQPEPSRPADAAAQEGQP